MKWLMQILLAVFLITPLQSWAFQNEPNGFRDLYWGESIEEIKETRTVMKRMSFEDSDVEGYFVDLKDNESRMISGVPMKNKFFQTEFWKGKLCLINIAFDDKGDNFEKFKSALIQLYGKRSWEESDKWVWEGKKTSIGLIRPANANFFMILMYSMPIMEQRFNEQARQGW